MGGFAVRFIETDNKVDGIAFHRDSSFVDGDHMETSWSQEADGQCGLSGVIDHSAVAEEGNESTRRCSASMEPSTDT